MVVSASLPLEKEKEKKKEGEESEVGDKECEFRLISERHHDHSHSICNLQSQCRFSTVQQEKTHSPLSIQKQSQSKSEMKNWCTASSKIPEIKCQVLTHANHTQHPPCGSPDAKRNVLASKKKSSGIPPLTTFLPTLPIFSTAACMSRVTTHTVKAAALLLWFRQVSKADHRTPKEKERIFFIYIFLKGTTQMT